MESAVSAIRLPKTYKEFIYISNKLWESIREDLESRLPEELKKWIIESKEYLFKLSKFDDNISIEKLTIGLSCLYHFFLNDLSTLNPLFDMILNSHNSNTMMFISTLIARISAETCETDDKFARRYLNRSIGLLKARTDFHSNMMGLFLIREISDPLPYFFIFNYPDAHHLLWSFVISENESIRTLAIDVFRHYLFILTRAHGYNLRYSFDTIFKNVIFHIKNEKKDSSIGSLSILCSLLDLKPSFFESYAQEVFEIVSPHLLSRKDRKSVV